MPGMSAGFPWEHSRTGCRISLGSPQEQMGAPGISQYRTGVTPRSTGISPGPHQHQQHPQDHTLRSPAPLGTGSLRLFQAPFTPKITKPPLFPFAGHSPSSQSLGELLHGMLLEHFRRASCSWDACSHGILQSTLIASNIEILGVFPDLGAWCGQEGPTGMRWEGEEGWV